MAIRLRYDVRSYLFHVINNVHLKGMMERTNHKLTRRLPGGDNEMQAAFLIVSPGP